MDGLQNTGAMTMTGLAWQELMLNVGSDTHIN